MWDFTISIQRSLRVLTETSFITKPTPNYETLTLLQQIEWTDTWEFRECFGLCVQKSPFLPEACPSVSHTVGHVTHTFAPITVDVTPRKSSVERPSFKIPRCPLIGRTGPCDQRSREVLCHARDRKRIVLNSFKLCCKHWWSIFSG